ncbi:hypothetical protein G9A89_012955 [Geosiphon pyriformis]|nr:hypothetical protein G9A89_012955 [Geosiphon pyriformis]
MDVQKNYYQTKELTFQENQDEWDLFIPLVLFAYQTIKQDTTQATPFKLVYGRTATLPVKIEVNTYLTEPITEENFQETLLRKTYNLIEIFENKQRRAADNIQKSQEKQRKRHDNQLPNKPVEFKIKDKVLLHHTKVEKQWSGKFDPK